MDQCIGAIRVKVVNAAPGHGYRALPVARKLESVNDIFGQRQAAIESCIHNDLNRLYFAARIEDLKGDDRLQIWTNHSPQHYMEDKPLKPIR